MQALRILLEKGVAKYVISQNVDGLCIRAGVPRDKISELHGNVFVERCPKCKVEFVRDLEIETVRIFGAFHPKLRLTHFDLFYVL